MRVREHGGEGVIGRYVRNQGMNPEEYANMERKS
jgi:hypothetical protein